MERRERPRGRLALEEFLDRAAPQPLRVGLDAAVERAQEALAAVGECLPRILAIEDERNEPGVCGDLAGDVAEMREQMLRGLGGFVLRSHEADEIRERFFAEDGVHRRAVVAHLPALKELQMIDRLPLVGGVEPQRVEEILLVAAKILDAALRHERDELRRDRALARPQPARGLAEHLAMLLDGERELRRRILRPVVALRERTPRQAALGEGGVIDQRQDRVEEGGRRQLDLPALLGGAILRHDGAHDLDVDVADAQLFGLAEVAALALQLGQLGVEPLCGVAAPREIEPHLEVEEFLRREIAQPAPHLVAVEGEPALVQQLPVAGEGLDEIVPVDFEKVLQDRELLVLIEFRRRLARPVEPEVADFTRDELPDLEHEHRGEVEIHMDAGEVRDHRDHVEVTLHRVQPHPRHERRLRHGIDVIRLMHVPEKDDVCHGRRVCGKRARAANRFLPPAERREILSELPARGEREEVDGEPDVALRVFPGEEVAAIGVRGGRELPLPREIGGEAARVEADAGADEMLADHGGERGERLVGDWVARVTVAGADGPALIERVFGTGAEDPLIAPAQRHVVVEVALACEQRAVEVVVHVAEADIQRGEGGCPMDPIDLAQQREPASRLPCEARAGDLREGVGHLCVEIRRRVHTGQSEIGELATGIRGGPPVGADTGLQRVAEADLECAGGLPHQAELPVGAPALGVEIEQHLRPAELRLRLDDVGRFELVAIVEQAQARAGGERRRDRVAGTEGEAQHLDLRAMRARAVAGGAIEPARRIAIGPRGTQRGIWDETERKRDGPERAGERSVRLHAGIAEPGAVIGAIGKFTIHPARIEAEVQRRAADLGQRGGVRGERVERAARAGGGDAAQGLRAGAGTVLIDAAGLRCREADCQAEERQRERPGQGVLKAELGIHRRNAIINPATIHAALPS